MMKKKFLSVAFVAVFAGASLAVGAGAAFSEPNANSADAPGQVAKACFDAPYGQIRQESPHPVPNGGLPALIEAHGPGATVSLCPAPAPKPAAAVTAAPKVTG
ncbi:MAG: hypothetical protein ACKOA9_00330 [Actinomycetota bacterium]